jgi:selenide, water dikinase
MGTDLASPSPIRLTEWTSCGGCAAKWGAAELPALLGVVPGSSGTRNHDLLVGLVPFDDAAVFRLSPEIALVSTTDFFPPLVDDPADFGAIAAANACSDIYAMGGRVLLALNIAAFPEQLPADTIRQIFEAAAMVVSEAGGIVAGGHTIRSEEPIFGLAVQGVIRPGWEFTKGGARPGDRLVLSKPLGTGIALASGEPATIAGATAGMRELNRAASEALIGHRAEVHAVTDVTGFGLLGHAWEMAERSDATLVFEGARLPLYDGALEAATSGMRTGGDPRNRQYVSNRVQLEVDDAISALAFDPQTSGGLLASVAPSVIAKLDGSQFTEIGRVVNGRASVVLR